MKSIGVPGRIRMPRRRRSLGWIALVAVLLALWPLSHAGSALVVAHDLSDPDAILMLASHEWERLPAAAALARLHPRALVLLTVPVSVSERNCHLCHQRVAWLNAEGIPSTRVVLLPRKARNTFEEAQAAREYLAGTSLSRLLVVTSPYHTRRASSTFEHVFAGASVALGTSPVRASQGNPQRWWSSAYDRYYVRYEWAALLKYRLIYGI